MHAHACMAYMNGRTPITYLDSMPVQLRVHVAIYVYYTATLDRYFEGKEKKQQFQVAFKTRAYKK